MSTHISVPPQLLLERILTLEIVRVTERAAVSAARLRGHGNEKAADQAAVDAMRRELNKLPIEGTVVIGEGERDEAPMLFIGEKVGLNAGPQVDIAVDPLEGTTLCAKNMPGAIATMAMAEGGTLLNAPDVYMEKIAIGPRYPKGVVDLDAPAQDNIRALAKAKGVTPEEITALILDRPRHADLVAAVRKAGASVRFITDGNTLISNVLSGSVDLVITNYLVPDAFLTWDGSINADWNTDTANWKNNVEPGLTYSDGQSVLFNDGWVYRTGVDLLSEVLGRFEEYARYSLPQIGGTTHGYPRRVDLAAARAMDLRLSTLSDFLAVCRGARVATPTRAAADRRRTAEAA